MTHHSRGFTVDSSGPGCHEAGTNALRVSRRHVLGMAIAAGGITLAGPVGSLLAETLKRTPGEILGPFYPVLRSVEKTADLTVVPGRPGRAAGQVIYVIGRVVNVQGQPLRSEE